MLLDTQFIVEVRLCLCCWLLLKNSRAVSQGSVITSAECAAEPVRMRAWKLAECLVSNLVLDDAVVDPDVAKIDVWTICANLPFICSRMDEVAYLVTSLEVFFLVGLNVTVGFAI